MGDCSKDTVERGCLFSWCDLQKGSHRAWKQAGLSVHLGQSRGGHGGAGSGWAQTRAGSCKEGGITRGGWEDPTGKGQISM